MLGEDVGTGCHIGDGAGELDDAGAGTGGQPHLVYYSFKQNLAFRTQRAVFLDMFVIHCRVAEDALSLESFSLYFARSLHSRRHNSTRLGLLPFHQPLRVDFSQKKLNVYTFI